MSWGLAVAERMPPVAVLLKANDYRCKDLIEVGAVSLRSFDGRYVRLIEVHDFDEESDGSDDQDCGENLIYKKHLCMNSI